MLAQLIQCCRCEFHTFPGATAYTQSAAAYTQSAAAYTQGAAAYMVSAAAYMGKVRIKLTQSSWAGAGTELANFLSFNIKVKNWDMKWCRNQSKTTFPIFSMYVNGFCVIWKKYL